MYQTIINVISMSGHNDSVKKKKLLSLNIFSTVTSGLKVLAANDLKLWHNGACVC